MTDSERIIEVQKASGLNFKKLAESIGLNTVQTLYDIKSGKHGISKDVAEKIKARYFNINLTWLLTGEGDMLLPIPKISQDVNGDNNTSVAGNGNNVSSTPSSLIDELVAQRKLTEKAQEQLSKAQEQMDRLISVIEKLTAK
ncbi:MAG: helix-turn-helix transcriptional regulator [Parabacteroides sp.]|nr:helix-turn-helix transcriptional regulator [Parabacteroides sp.]